MNKKIVSLFTFGLVLILVGGIGKFFDWSPATIIIAMGLTFESFALILFAWKHIKK